MYRIVLGKITLIGHIPWTKIECLYIHGYIEP